MKKLNWKFWGILVLIFIIGWVVFGNISYNGGYEDGYNQSSYDSRDYYMNASSGIINNSIESFVNDMTLEFSNKCIEYFCEKVFESDYLEGNSTTNYLGKCSGEEYKSVGALEECRKMFFED